MFGFAPPSRSSSQIMLNPLEAGNIMIGVPCVNYVSECTERRDVNLLLSSHCQRKIEASYRISSKNNTILHTWNQADIFVTVTVLLAIILHYTVMVLGIMCFVHTTHMYNYSKFKVINMHVATCISPLLQGLVQILSSCAAQSRFWLLHNSLH